MLEQNKQDLKTPADNVFTPQKTVRESVQEHVQAVEKTVQTHVSARARNTKSRRKHSKNRTVLLLKWLLPLLSLFLSTASTLCYCSILIQLTAWLMFFILTIVCDPLDTLDRILAPQSRWIIGFVLFLCTVNMWYKDMAMLGITIVLSCAGLAGVFYGNQYWMDAYSWEYSPQVQRSLYLDADADTPAIRAWQSHGKRESRTALIELGLEHGENLLDIYAKPLYLVGYYNGRQKTAGLKKQLQQLENSKNTLSNRLEKVKEQLQEKELQVQKLQEQLQNAKSMDQTSTLRLEKRELEARLDSLQRENANLRAANEELLEGIADPVEQEAVRQEITVQTGENLQERVLVARAQGLSYRKIGELLGISKSQAFSICKAAEQEQNKIIILN